jgi:uncharacterized protein
MMIKRKILLFLFLGFTTLSLAAKEVPPPSNTLVTDYAGILQPQEQAALERKLVAYDDSTSTQIAVVIEQSLEGDDLFDYTLRLVEKWGIGREGKDNGILLYIAYDDRKIIIQTGYGAEGFLPDALAKRIIENILKPAFRQSQYYAGIDRATDIMMDLGSGEYYNEGDDRRRNSEEGIPPLAMIIIIIVAIIIIRSLFNDDGGDGGYHRGGRYDSRRSRGGGWIFLPGGGWGSGGGGGGGFGGGGGGFGGFGGGGFGGGGASGGW